MEIATGQSFIGIGENQRIVGDAIGLCFQRCGRLTQDIERSAHHLWLAAQAIGVLHTLVAFQMRSADGGIAHQFAQGMGGVDLALMTAQGMDARIKRRVGALGGFGGERAGDQRGLQQYLSLEQPGQGIGGGELRAVEQGQPLFRTGCQGLKTGFFQRPQGWHPGAIDFNLADAKHTGGHVRQRCQIARGADRSLTWNDWDQIVIQQSLHQFERLWPDARSPLRQRGQLERQHQPHHGLRRRRTYTGGVTEDYITLERRQISVMDARRGQFAETGIDAVDRLAPGQNAGDGGGALSHSRDTGRIELESRAAIDIAPDGQGNSAGREDHTVWP